MWRRALAALAPRHRAAAEGATFHRSAATLPACSFSPPPYEGPPKAEVLALRKQYLNPGMVENDNVHRVCWRTISFGTRLGGGFAPTTLPPPPPPTAALLHHFKDPVMIVDGHMQYLFDEKGRRYLDVSERKKPLQCAETDKKKQKTHPARAVCGGCGGSHDVVWLWPMAG